MYNSPLVENPDYFVGKSSGSEVDGVFFPIAETVAKTKFPLQRGNLVS